MLREFTQLTPSLHQLVTPAYAIETGSYTLAPWQTITAEGIKLNTPPGKELEDPNIYNGHGRIFAPDGQNLVPHPDLDFQGLLYVDVRLSTPHQTNQVETIKLTNDRSTSTKSTSPSPSLTL